MASKNRRSTLGLIDQARAEPFRFEFFQLVRLLRLHYSRSGRLDPEARPHDDPLRFGSQLTLNFPASEVSDMQFERTTRRSVTGHALSEVQVTFMGLVGASGVLPRPYTEMLMDRHIQSRDDAAHAFLDMFSHRMVALFYEAWQKYKFYIEYERKGSSEFNRYVLNLVGFGTESQKSKFTEGHSLVRREMYTYFSGLLCQRPRGPVNLETMLDFYFSLPFKVKPFAGQWLKLNKEQCSRLGTSNVSLGQSAVAGSRVWDYQSCIRIEIGPLELSDYQRFLPGAVDYKKLIEVVRFYIGVELDFEVSPLLKREALPSARLGLSGGLALGWLGWLKHPGAQTEQIRCAIFRIPFDGVTL